MSGSLCLRGGGFHRGAVVRRPVPDVGLAQQRLMGLDCGVMDELHQEEEPRGSLSGRRENIAGPSR